MPNLNPLSQNGDIQTDIIIMAAHSVKVVTTIDDDVHDHQTSTRVCHPWMVLNGFNDQSCAQVYRPYRPYDWTCPFARTVGQIPFPASEAVRLWWR